MTLRHNFHLILTNANRLALNQLHPQAFAKNLCTSKTKNKKKGHLNDQRTDTEFCKSGVRYNS